MRLLYKIIYEILLRLPVRTLFRFQCVYKSWKAMISDPAFRKAHRCQAKQNPLLFTATTDVDNPDSTIIQLQTWDKRGTLINKFVETRFSNMPDWQVTTCLDLICIHNCDIARFWNPTTKESIMLPLPKSPGSPAQNEHRQTVAMGFGYVSSTDVFKVLHIFDTLQPDHNKYFCQVFTLCVDDQWRAAPAIPPFVNEIGVNDAPFVNGAIHFLPINGTEDVGIAAFDLEHEKWSMIPSPPLPYSRSLCTFLYSLGGLLCALKYPHRRERRHFDIWLLKDYKKGLWVKEYNIDLSALNHYSPYTNMFPLTIEKDGRLLIEVSRLGSYWWYYYDTKGKNHQEIETPEHCVRTNIYIEGFTSLGSR